MFMSRNDSCVTPEVTSYPSASRNHSCESDVKEKLNQEGSMNLQQSAPPLPPVHPDVHMKTLPFYDVLDVLIKPSSLGLSLVSPTQRQWSERSRSRRAFYLFTLTKVQIIANVVTSQVVTGTHRGGVSVSG